MHEDGDDEGAVPHVAAAVGVRHGPHDPRGGPDRQEGEDQARHQHPHLDISILDTFLNIYR